MSCRAIHPTGAVIMSCHSTKSSDRVNLPGTSGSTYVRLSSAYYSCITNIFASSIQSRLYGNLPGGIVFNSESIFIFTLSAGDNIQITAIREFIDTKQAAEFAAAASKPAAAAAPE